MSKKPPIVRAKSAGSCYLCGRPIYVGDRIRIVANMKELPLKHPTFAQRVQIVKERLHTMPFEVDRVPYEDLEAYSVVITHDYKDLKLATIVAFVFDILCVVALFWVWLHA